MDISRLNQIIESLLFIAKADSGTLTLPCRVEDAGRLLASFAEDARALTEDRNIQFLLRANPAGKVEVEPNLLRQLLLNLVSNALNVSTSGSTITLASTLSDQRWTLTLADEGPGLPATELEHVFERFVRYDHSRAGHNINGQGLGLAICHSIVRLHAGTIRAENRTDRSGLQVIVDLPRYQSDPPASKASR